MQEFESLEKEEIIRKICHDLRGPIINIQGFSGELAQSIAAIEALFENLAESLPAGIRDDISRLITDDCNPCLTFLAGSADRLQSEISKLESNYIADSRGNSECSCASDLQD